MADYDARIAPFINIEFVVTSEFWEQPRNHRGLDIATYHSAGDNVPLYSMCNGEVILKSYDTDGYGNYIIMKDSSTGLGFLYGHLRDPSNKNVGDQVSLGEQVGIEGTTGSSTGIHLHLEMQDISNRSWIFHGDREDYLNPADFLGIPNIEGTTAIYDGIPVPPTPTYERIKSKFPWVLYANKLRKKY
ncbi:MAG: M23 family metallopeptidase [Treponema sp.]|nr:M23 family metallopeptidase [Treponema sp.]